MKSAPQTLGISRNTWLFMFFSFGSIILSGNSRGEKKMENKENNHIVVFTPSVGKKPYDVAGTAFSIFTFSNAVFGTPIESTLDYKLLPNIIKDWSWDYSAKKYRIKIDTTRKFHNGRSVKASDFEFMLLKSYYTPVVLQEKKWLANIRGTKDIVRGQPFKSGTTSGIKIIDDETIDIFLESESPTFLYNLSKSVPSLVPPEEMRSDYLTFKNLPIGAGNYKVIWDDPNSSLIRLERVSGPLGPPRIVDIIGDCDFVKCNPDIVLGQTSSLGIKTLKGYTSLQGDTTMGISTVYFNFSNSVGANLNFRRLIDKVIDRSKLVKGENDRKPLFEILPGQFMGRLENSDPYDLSAAKRLFEELPREIREGTHLVRYHGAIDYPPYIQSLEKQMTEIGLKVKFERTKAHKIGEGDQAVVMYLIGMPVDFQDPLNVFSIFLSDGPRPFQHPPKNVDFDTLFFAALNTSDKELQAKKIRDISQKVRDDLYVVPLFEVKMEFHLNGKIETIGKQAFGPFLDLEQVRLK